MKKKVKLTALILALVLLAVLLIPIRGVMLDGGSVEYKAVLYRVTHYRRLTYRDGAFGRNVGYRVDILGHTVFEETEFVTDEPAPAETE